MKTEIFEYSIKHECKCDGKISEILKVPHTICLFLIKGENTESQELLLQYGGISRDLPAPGGTQEDAPAAMVLHF